MKVSRLLVVVMAVSMLLVADAGRNCYRNGVLVDCKTKKPLVPNPTPTPVSMKAAEPVKEAAPVKEAIGKAAEKVVKSAKQVAKDVVADAKLAVKAVEEAVEEVVAQVEKKEPVVHKKSSMKHMVRPKVVRPKIVKPKVVHPEPAAPKPAAPEPAAPEPAPKLVEENAKEVVKEVKEEVVKVAASKPQAKKHLIRPKVVRPKVVKEVVQEVVKEVEEVAEEESKIKSQTEVEVNMVINEEATPKAEAVEAVAEPEMVAGQPEVVEQVEEPEPELEPVKKAAPVHVKVNHAKKTKKTKVTKPKQPKIVVGNAEPEEVIMKPKAVKRSRHTMATERHKKEADVPPVSVHKRPQHNKKKKLRKHRAARCFKAGVLIDCDTKEPIVQEPAETKPKTHHVKPTPVPKNPEEEHPTPWPLGADSVEQEEEEQEFEVEVDLEERMDDMPAAPTQSLKRVTARKNMHKPQDISEHTVESWLDSIGLGMYTHQFTSSGFDDLELLSVLSAEEREDLFVQLGLKLGHKFKLRRALTDLSRKHTHSEDSLYADKY